MPYPVPRGFRLTGVHCGVKQDTSKEDLTLIVSDRDAVAAGVYTQNVVHAAAVALNRDKTPGDAFRVVVANSGNANTCTGPRGREDAQAMLRLAAAACGARPEQALVMSTGLIGAYLPMDAIAAGIKNAAGRLGHDEDDLKAAARGLLTTDQYAKIAARTIQVAGATVHLTGIAKGAGMIGPNMATMLATVLTDADLAPADAQRALAAAVDVSFNCISVEGHTSTSDTVLLLASRAATAGPLSGSDLETFQAALTEVCTELAVMIPNDGEGASHLITIDVSGCASRGDAQRIAKNVANSALVKTGIAGADPNWGRIVSAAGCAGVPFDPDRVSLSINGYELYRQGVPVPFDEREVSTSIRTQRETRIALSLAEGDASARFWTSDLTVDYVRFNSEYTT